MLEFLWSSSRKPAPADRGEAAGVPPQSPGERPEPEALGQSVEPSRCAEDPNPLSPGSQAESSEPPPAAAERQAGRLAPVILERTGGQGKEAS